MPTPPTPRGRDGALEDVRGHDFLSLEGIHEAMTERAAELRRLAERLRDRDVVDDAFLAKSFTDRLLILDVPRGESIPDDVERLLADYGLRGAVDVYGDDERASAGLGDVGDATRHHFVDVRTRGSHQSYVVE